MREKNRRIGIGIAAALLLLGGASAAHAQYRQPRGYPPPPPPGYYPPPAYGGMYRQGLVFGLGIGGGAISASNCGPDCGGAFALQFDIGGMLNPQLALVFDGWVNFHGIPQTDIVAVNGIYTGALQYFVTDIVWLKGGVGYGGYQQTSSAAGRIGDDSGLALLAAGGVEVVQSQNFALDIQLRLGHAFYSVAKDMTNVALMLGVNWY
jgi:hypothetical protein